MNKTTRSLAGTAVFAALAFVISLLEFPIFPAASFLQFDFSLVFILLAGFAFGPVSGIAASAVKELLRYAIGSGTGGVGEIANFLVTAAFILIPTVVYRYKKGLPIVIFTLIGGIILEAGVALITNRYINFPFFMGEVAEQTFKELWVYVLLFNIIKTVAVSVITLLLYKRLSKFLKALDSRAPKRKAKESPVESVSADLPEAVLPESEKMREGRAVKCAYCGTKFMLINGTERCPKCGAQADAPAGDKNSAHAQEDKGCAKGTSAANGGCGART